MSGSSTARLPSPRQNAEGWKTDRSAPRATQTPVTVLALEIVHLFLLTRLSPTHSVGIPQARKRFRIFTVFQQGPMGASMAEEPPRSSNICFGSERTPLPPRPPHHDSSCDKTGGYFIPRRADMLVISCSFAWSTMHPVKGQTIRASNIQVLPPSSATREFHSTLFSVTGGVATPQASTYHSVLLRCLYERISASHAVLSHRLQLTLYVICPTSRGVSSLLQAISAWLVETRCPTFQHGRDLGVYSMAMRLRQCTT